LASLLQGTACSCSCPLLPCHASTLCALCPDTHTRKKVAAVPVYKQQQQAAATMPNNKKMSQIKIEPGVGDSQEEAAAAAAAEEHAQRRRQPSLRRRADKVGHAVLKMLAELKFEIKIKDAALQAKDAFNQTTIQAKDVALQAKDAALLAKDAALQASADALQSKTALLQARDAEICRLQAELVRLHAEAALPAAAPARAAAAALAQTSDHAALFPSKAQNLEVDGKPNGIKDVTAMQRPPPSRMPPSASAPTSAAPKSAPAPATRPASSLFNPTTGAVKPPPTIAFDLQSILAKVKALAEQSVQASKSARTATSAPSSKRRKL